MTILKTDFSDGDILYSGTTSDTDKLNGITNTINGKFNINQIYAGTDLDTSATAATDENTYEFTAIAAADLVNKNYLIISIASTFETTINGVGNNMYTKFKVQTKEVAGAYSDSLAYKTIFRVQGLNGTIDCSKSFSYVHTLTAGEKSAGVQVKLFISSTAPSGVTHTHTLIQTILSC